MTCVVLFWDLLIVMFIGLPQIQRRLTRGIVWIERIAGGVLIIFGSAIALRFLQSVTF
jgi:threonine/homoserine/homoserine lactone efflux protein